ncbi:hypothetical protein DSL92_05675 [Billgrantia gudaonensis]|uniref:Uncharacterized protein n=1 Tax=Billgrantia gudaonensis TaxID=376427 RepID=A0A3S0R4Z5_9GAMM|nr:hypothetical protein DSL92_05675 [Halomonas gudaonensis]
MENHRTGVQRIGASAQPGHQLRPTPRLNLYGGWAGAIRHQVKELFVLDYYECGRPQGRDRRQLRGRRHLPPRQPLPPPRPSVTKIDDVVGQEGMAGISAELETRGVSATIGYDWERLSASLSLQPVAPETQRRAAE